jgi:RNA ligase (TIGR02306 family)
MTEINITSTPAAELLNAEGQTIAEAVRFRKLATIQKIVSISPIEGADNIEVARVLNWDVVVKKGEFSVGSLAAYFEIDSFIPNTLAPFLTKPGHFPKTYNGVDGEKLRTIRLKGQISQGLLLPVKVVTDKMVELCGNPMGGFVIEGDDVTDVLGIQKWEAPVSAQLAGMARGNFPSRIVKTDQERIQNLTRAFANGVLQAETYEVQEKCEGSSTTCYILDGEFGTCSRNLDLKETEGNTFWDTARALGVEQKLREFGQDIAVQFELIGPGVQQNHYKLNKHEFRLFDVQLPNEGGRYMDPTERAEFAAKYGFTQAPLVDANWTFGDKTIDDVIKMADGKSLINPTVNREGLVFKANSRKRFTWKAISNLYLSKMKD